MISRKLVVLLCSAFFVAGLGIGFLLAEFVPQSPEDQLVRELAKEELARKKRQEENAVADDILFKLRTVSDSIMRSSIGSKTGEDDLKAAFDSLKLDERWTFQQTDRAAWIGYKLKDVSAADRKRLAEKASFANLYKSPSNDRGNEYDGGDVVYLYEYIPMTFKW